MRKEVEMNVEQRDDPQARPDTQMREARRRLLKGGLAGAPIVLSTMATPAMATTQTVLGSCQTSSRFASTPHASKAPPTQFTVVKAFDLGVILRAIVRLYQPNLNMGAVSGAELGAVIGLSGRVGGLIVYKVNTGLVTGLLSDLKCTLSISGLSADCHQLSLYQELLLLTYLNLRVPVASTDLKACLGLSEQDVINLAGGGSITRGGRTLTPADVEAWLRNVFNLAAGAAIDLKVLNQSIL